MIILYRELLPGRNKRTLDYRRASKRVTARRAVPIVLVTRVCCAKMKIARANSLERLLITVPSDMQEPIERERVEAREERQLSLAQGGGERWAPIFTTRAVSGARDTPPRVNCRMGVRQINKPVGLKTRAKLLFFSHADFGARRKNARFYFEKGKGDGVPPV